MSEDSMKVADLHLNGGLNCAQSMLTVYGKYFGLPEETAKKLGIAFSGGLGRSGKTCGAVTGACLLFGLASDLNNPEHKNEACSLMQEYIKLFKEAHGSIRCRDLLGYDMSKPEDMNVIRQNNLTKTICPPIGKAAGEILEKLLAEKLTKSV